MAEQNQVQDKKSWQERQKERELESKKAKQKRTAKRLALWAIAFLVAAFLVRWYHSSFSVKGPDYSEQVPVLGRNHIPDGTRFDGYNSNPPTSGPHYPQPANAVFYESELPDEHVVHNLEHGNVWIAYRPSLAKEAIEILRGFAGGLVIVTPRAANDTDIAIAAWGRLDKFNLENGALDARRVRDFILRYQNQGPEKVGIPSHLR